MKALLETNVLIALVWREHFFHRAAQDWFQRNARYGWATCPVTQSGFLRIVSNASFSPNAFSIAGALFLLERNLQHPMHEFWPDELTVPQSLSLVEKPLRGHRQLTDAYLLGLAIHKHARFVTFDGKIASLLPESRQKSGLIVNLAASVH